MNNTSYGFTLKVFTLEIVNVQISSTATTSKVIAAGTFFSVGLILVVGAYSDKLVSLAQYLIK